MFQELFYLSPNEYMINQETHRRILYQLIKDIFTLPYAKHIAFKWWTACYFFYELDRFSTDIDLDIIQLPEWINIYDDIAMLAKNYGIVKEKRNLIVLYEKWYDAIKIDLSRKIWKNNHYEFKDFYGTTIQLQTPWTIFANKLVASTERTVNRDLYDIYFMLTKWFPINEWVVQERTWTWKHTLYTSIIDKIYWLWKNHKILDGLWEVLNHKKKVFVKNKLLPELLGLLEMQRDFTK